MSWLTLKYGGSYDYKKNKKVYQSEKLPGFVCLYDTDTKLKSIFRYNQKVQDGSYRIIYSNGNSTYGIIIFSKSPNNGEDNRQYRLHKYASGDIEYDEKIWVNGQDNGWRELTTYKFNPRKLEWRKVDL